jgi:hypothetical protein
MKRDCQLHDDPKSFNLWSKGGICPYTNSKWQRTHYFNQDSKLWKPGKPQMKDKELILLILKELKLKIKRK